MVHDDCKSEYLGTDAHDRLRMVIPLLVELEDNLAVHTTVKWNQRNDQEGEGGQVEHSQIRIAFEAIAGQHDLHTEVEAEQGH